ncbi:MAG: hypothetical protein K8R11_01485 [Methanococcoides sp.]|nr:hypothetical protein [Methanococcoides sp.]
MTPKVRETLNTIIDRFKSGDIPEAVAYSMFPIPNLPSSKWSLLNRTLMFFSGTQDARGIRQWNSANRNVKKGSKAMYILVPYFRKSDDDREEQQVLTWFGCSPVYKVEDTKGEPLEYENIELPDLPFIERAQQWGISLKAIPGNYRYYGYYSPGRKEIAVATSSECVFFHELAHAAHHILKGNFKPGQDSLQEVVAELSAQTLAVMVGKSAEDTIGNSFRYIKTYAEKLEISVHSACLKVMSETEKVLKLILTGYVDNRNSIKEAA